MCLFPNFLGLKKRKSFHSDFHGVIFTMLISYQEEKVEYLKAKILTDDLYRGSSKNLQM